MAFVNNVDPDQSINVQSDQDLHCLNITYRSFYQVMWILIRLCKHMDSVIWTYIVQKCVYLLSWTQAHIERNTTIHIFYHILLWILTINWIMSPNHGYNSTQCNHPKVVYLVYDSKLNKMVPKAELHTMSWIPKVML